MMIILKYGQMIATIGNLKCIQKSAESACAGMGCGETRNQNEKAINSFFYRFIDFFKIFCYNIYVRKS